jgi:hypothetical protein
MVIPEPRFYLKQPNSTEPSLISLQAKFYGERVFMSTGDKVLPSEWDFVRQRALVSKKSPGNSDINLWLDKISTDFKALFRNLLIDGINPTSTLLMKALAEKLNRYQPILPPKAEPLTLTLFIKQYIDQCRSNKSISTVKSYGATYKHMDDYFKLIGGNFDFDAITIEWRGGFIRYLQGLGIGRNTEGKHIKIVKLFLNEARERGLHNNLHFKSKSFSKPHEDVHKVFVTMSEIGKIASVDLSNDKLNDIVRDYFIISCLTSLRYSDFVNIRPENVKENTIQMITQKTGESVIIPIAPLVRSILVKYQFNLPKAPCNQVFNRALKEIGKLAGLDEEVTITKTLGGKKQSTVFKKYQLITAHTGRRSMISNCILEGISTSSIMLISAHKSLKVFQGYVRLNQVQNADALAEHSFFKKII